MDDKLFQAFKIANSGAYLEKLEFYQLKKKILPQLGTPDGYDLQVLKKYQGNGTSKEETHYLLRYRLNGEIFHIPQDHEPEPLFAELKNKIKGRIIHETYASWDYYISLLTLLQVYDTEAFGRVLTYNPLARHYWDQHLKWSNKMRVAV